MAMEERLIDANALMKAIRSFRWIGVPNTLKLMFDYLKLIIRDQPTVDAVKVVHGRWEKMDTRYVEQFKCSVCRSEVYVQTCMGEPMFDYCPHCGAKMDGGNP